MSYRVIIEPHSQRRLIDWKELSEYRDLFYYLIRRDITVLYKQTVLGLSWAIIRPVFGTVVFSIIFGGLAKIPSDGIPYPLFSYCALLPWTYFSTVLTESSGSLVTNVRVITKIYFPRILIPVTPVFSKALDLVIGSSILFGLMVWYGIYPGVEILLLPLLVLILFLFSGSLGIMLSALAIQYRDVRHAVQFMVQILMYGAPVVWPVSLIPDQFRILYGLYPMAGVIEGFRSVILNSTPVPWDLIAAGLFSSLMIFAVALLYFGRLERSFADVA